MLDCNVEHNGRKAGIQNGAICVVYENLLRLCAEVAAWAYGRAKHHLMPLGKPCWVVNPSGTDPGTQCNPRLLQDLGGGTFHIRASGAKTEPSSLAEPLEQRVVQRGSSSAQYKRAENSRPCVVLDEPHRLVGGPRLLSTLREHQHIEKSRPRTPILWAEKVEVDAGTRSRQRNLRREVDITLKRINSFRCRQARYSVSGHTIGIDSYWVCLRGSVLQSVRSVLASGPVGKRTGQAKNNRR